MKKLKIVLVLCLLAAACYLGLRYSDHIKKLLPQQEVIQQNEEPDSVVKAPAPPQPKICYMAEDIVTVPLEDKDDGYYISLTVNGVPMRFLVDSGCSGMTIGYTEYMFLKNQDKVGKDIIQGRKMQLANGRLCDVAEISLDSISFGSIKIDSVSCLVSLPDSLGNVYDAPSLIGFNTLFSRVAEVIIIDLGRHELSIKMKGTSNQLHK